VFSFSFFADKTLTLSSSSSSSVLSLYLLFFLPLPLHHHQQDTVNYPVHLKNLSLPQLRQLCKELRSDIIHTVSKTGGHLGASLGVTELTVALHYVFNTPDDRIVWDVGHQAYGHKILTGETSFFLCSSSSSFVSGELREEEKQKREREKKHTKNSPFFPPSFLPLPPTPHTLRPPPPPPPTHPPTHRQSPGRRSKMSTIRQGGGLSGFTNRTESEYDPFGAGHSSTSVSAALGMAVGRDFKARKNSCIAVIGDGAITGGMAYEAMNHAGFLDTNMIVILNDNQQVSLPTQYNGKNQDPVGGLSSALARLQANRPLRELREIAKGVSKQLPEPLQEATAKIDEYARGMISGSGSTLFEELGLYYIGPLDGHNLDDLIAVLQDVKSAATVGPVLVRGSSSFERERERERERKRKEKTRKKNQLFLSFFLHLLPTQPNPTPISFRSTSSPRRAAATRPPRPPATRCTASASTTLARASR